MTREEMDAQIHFLEGVINVEYDAIANDTKQYLLLRLTAIHKDGERRVYNPPGFVFVKLNQLVKPLDEMTDIGEKTRQAINAKMQIIHLIEAIRQQVEYFKTKKLDFSGIYKRIEGIIDQTKIDLETENRTLQNKFIEKQTELITNQIEANKTSTITNRNIAAFTGIAAFWYLHDFIKGIIPSTIHLEKEAIAVPTTIILLYGGYQILKRIWKQPRQLPEQKQSIP